MAFAVAFSLLQTIDQILKDDQYPISVQGKQKIASMLQQVSSFKQLLEDFPKEASSLVSQTTDQILKDDQEKLLLEYFPKEASSSVSRTIDHWKDYQWKLQQVNSFKQLLEDFPKEASSLERRMRDAANEAEDILEHFMYEQIRLRHKLSRAAAAGIKKPNSNPKQYDFDELKWVMEEMDSINREVMAIKIGDVQLTDFPAPISPISSSTVVSPGHDNSVVGFDEHLLKINVMLCGRGNLQVIRIVGMAGIGKTTLARMAYNDPLIQQHFDIRVWITVSHDYKIQNILQNLLHAMNEFEAKGSEQSIQKMEERVREKLMDRRYIIVLDDVWSTNVWDDYLQSIFPDDNNGSRIMCTSRLLLLHFQNQYNSSQYHMRLMSVDESWNLLRKMVLRDQDYDDEIAKIGREIAGKCGGLPLAIELIAGVLSTVSKTSASWEKIAENVNSTLYESKDGQFEKIISLSYTHLPHHLRSCFLYMGSFPEGYEIHVSKLIKLWIAEGFLMRDPEKVAELYLEVLINASLAFVKGRKYNGQIKSCSIHVLVREFCKRKAQEEKFQCRQIIARSDLKCLAKTYGSTIRTVICFEPNETSLDAVRKLRLLRVLDVVDANSNIYSLPAQVFELFHLRYLAFGCPMKIPPAISMLQNLQTLIIYPRKLMGSQNYSMDDEVYLPLEIWMIPQLRHLVSFFDILPDPEQTSFALENLQTLSVVKKFLCNQKLLERIPHLKKLGITFFGDKYAESCQLNNLVYLYELETLKLLWNRDSLFGIKVNPVYPETLKKLTLSGWRLPWNHMEAVGSLPNLQVLKLRHYACQGNAWVITEEQFHRLEYLLIDESDIQNWITKARRRFPRGHLPKLMWLAIHRCPLLKEIPDSIVDTPCLKQIVVGNGNDSLLESAKWIQVGQRLRNHYLQVQFVHDQETSMDVDDEFDGSKSKF